MSKKDMSRFSFDEFTKMMQRSLSTKIIAILDCCYSGAAKVSKGYDEDAVRLGRAVMHNKSQALESEGKCVLAASQALQQAYLLKEHNHSLFTYYLLDGLRGANGESVDNNGNVTPDSLGKYVYDKVTEFSPNQRPIKKVEASGDIILAHYPHFATRPIDKHVPMQDATSIIKKGQEYLDKGEFQNAVDYLEEVIKEYPNNAEVWTTKGSAFDKLDRRDDAIKCFDISISLDPKNEKPWGNKGVILHNLGRHDDAIKCFQKAIELDPHKVSWYAALGSSLSEKGRFDEAIRYFDKGIEVDPTAALVWLAKGHALKTQRKHALADKGIIYYEQGKHDDAIKYLDKAIEYIPTYKGNKETVQSVWSAAGFMFYTLKRYSEAIKCYDKAIEIEANESTWNMKGFILNAIGRSTEALECYNKALRINANNEHILNNKGISLYNLGKYHEAIYCFDRILVLNPNAGQVLKNKADALMKLEHRADAQRCYKRASKLGIKT